LTLLWLALLWLALLWLALLWLALLRLALLRLTLLWLTLLRWTLLWLALLWLALLWLALLWLALLRLALLRLALLRLALLRLALLWLALLWLALLRLALLWVALLRLSSAVFGEFTDLFVQLVKSIFELFGLLCQLLSFGVLFVEFLLFSGFAIVGRCWLLRLFGLLGLCQLPGCIFKLLADVFDVLPGLFKVSLAEFAEGIIQGLHGGCRDIIGLLCDFASELFGFVAGLLELVGDFLGIAGGIAGFFVDAFGEVLLAACEVLELFGGFSGAIELGFASGLEEFLFALKEVIQVGADFLLLLLQALAFLGELLVEFFGLLSGFGSGLSLLLEFFGVSGEFFGIECESVEVCEVLFELCGLLNFFDGAIEFIAGAVEFVGGLLEVIDGGIAFGGDGLIEQFRDVLADVLGQFGKLCGLFLHERVLAGLFSESLEFVALRLVFFAEPAGFLAGVVVPVALGLIAKLCGSGGVFAELFGHGFEGIDELLVGLPESLASESFGIVANANGPGAFPDHLGPGDLSLVRGAHPEFDCVILFHAERLQIDAEFVGDFGGTVIEWRCRDDANGILVFANVQFEEADADIVGDEAVEWDDVVGPHLEAVGETGDIEHWWGIGRDDQSAIRFAGVCQTVFVCGIEAKASTSDSLEAEHSCEAVRGKGHFGDDRSLGCGDGICGAGWLGIGSTCHGDTGGSSSEFFRELFRGGGSRAGGGGRGGTGSTCGTGDVRGGWQ
jgi:hypothetical protein